MNPLTLVSYNDWHRIQLTNFIEHGIGCPVFMIAEHLGYITHEERRALVYKEHISVFVTARTMLAMIILMDNGEEF